MDEILSELDELLGRWANLVADGPVSGWQTARDILRNDIDEFAQSRFKDKSPDRAAIMNALYPRSFSIYGSQWQNFMNDYGQEIPSALALVRHRIVKGQARLAEDEPDQHLIEPGTPHSAYVFLRDIVETASQSVFLVDPYVDRSLFSLLTNAPAGVEIRILTRQQNVPADFVAEASKFTQQTGANLECRAGLNDFHDRFLVADDKLFFSGASFKDLGKKGSVVAEVNDIKGQTLNELEARWNSASSLK